MALVLSGGGARGAYEAGILRYLREGLARRMGHQVPLDIVTGTSVGAINACYLAATSDDPAGQGRRLCDVWRALRVEEVLSLRLGDMVRGARLLVGGGPVPVTGGGRRSGGLLDTSGLERFVVRAIPWKRISPNIAAGRLEALAVSATQVGSGHTVVFVEKRGEMPPAWSRDPHITSSRVRVGPRHALASAAIPMLFPAVKIGGHVYTDGGLRQNTPMSPAIRLGADRILVVSLRHRESAAERAALGPERDAAYPRPLYVAGKALNALLLDHTDYDLDRMDRLNAILKAGRGAFGDRFLDILNRELIRLRGAPLREIEAVHIRPSQDIGTIAASFIHERKVSVSGRVARRLLDRLARAEAEHEADLLSYLLFDGNFAAALADLGYHDAAAQEDDLAELFRAGR